MSNSTATGGYIQPVAAAVSDADLLRVLHPMIVGITGLDPASVRPMWQRNPAAVPANGINWCAFGISNTVAEFGDFQTIGAMTRWEVFELDCSFYGDNCQRLAAQLRDGIQIDQNRAGVAVYGIKPCYASDITHVPELVNDQFYQRADVSLTMRRQLDRSYAILDFVNGQAEIITEILPPLPLESVPHKTISFVDVDPAVTPAVFDMYFMDTESDTNIFFIDLWTVESAWFHAITIGPFAIDTAVNILIDYTKQDGTAGQIESNSALAANAVYQSNFSGEDVPKLNTAVTMSIYCDDVVQGSITLSAGIPS